MQPYAAPLLHRVAQSDTSVPQYQQQQTETSSNIPRHQPEQEKITIELPMWLVDPLITYIDRMQTEHLEHLERMPIHSTVAQSKSVVLHHVEPVQSDQQVNAVGLTQRKVCLEVPELPDIFSTVR